MADPAPNPSPKRARRWRARAAVYSTLGLASGAAALAGLGEFAFYAPARASTPAPLGADEIWFTAADGVRLHGWFLPAQARTAGPAPTIVFAHGNAGSLGDHLAFADFLPGAGFNVLMFDYRSYGRSEGPTRWLRRAALVRDTAAAIDHAAARADVDPARIGLFGYSLGGVIALAAAAERPGARAVAVGGAFATWRGIAADTIPVLGAWCVPPGCDAVSSAAALGARPLLVLHAERDEIVPVAHARRIEAAARAAGVRVESHYSSVGRHNDMLDLDAAARTALIEFFERELR